MKRFFLRLRNALRPGWADPDLAREVASHLALLEDDFRRRGKTPEEARRAARRAFGGVEQTKDRQRDARSFAWLDDFRWDLAYSLRSLRQTPGFTAVVVLTLALGIGANTAIFSVVRGVLLQPLPYKDPSRIVRIWENLPATPMPNGQARRIGAMNVREFLEVQARSRTLSHVTSFGQVRATMLGGVDAARMDGFSISVATFPMLGVQPVLGRWFTREEGTPGKNNVIIFSDEGWRRFGADPDVLGHVVTFTGDPTNPMFQGVAANTGYTVIGVMPRGFQFPYDGVQFWIPRVLVPRSDNRPSRTAAIARLSDGVSPELAASEIDAISREVRGEPGASQNATEHGGVPRFELVSLQNELTNPVRPALLVLIAAVGVVLLIACVNVANLLLARTTARQREFAVRIAIGAGRGRLVRQLITESLLLAALGGIVGTALAFEGVHLFRTLGTGLSRIDLGSTAVFPRLADIRVDGLVLAFALGLSIVTGMLFGLAPALRHSQLHLSNALRDAHASTRTRLRSVLVVVEIALATLLLVSGGLLMRSFVRLVSVDPGYNPSRVLTFQVSLPGQRSSAQLKTYAEDLVARLQALPGVEAAAYANQLPMVGIRDTSGGLWRTPGVRAPSPDGPDARLVSRDYLKVMGIRVITGRGFGPGDGAGQPRVLLINDALARLEFASENPVGKMVYVGRDPAPWTIVGIVANLRQFGLDREPEPQFFADLRQWPLAGLMPTFPTGAYYAIRTTSSPTSMLATTIAMVREQDPEATIDDVATMEQIVSNSVTRPRMYAVLLGIFAGVAVALAAVGLYGVMAYSVTQRTREIGIRMALGAQRVEVMQLILRQSTRLVAIGLVCGLAGAAVATRYLEGLLFGLTPLDPSTFVAVTVMFAAVAMLASFVPARRATRVDPLIALRCE